jgi:hypothetical protein
MVAYISSDSPGSGLAVTQSSARAVVVEAQAGPSFVLDLTDTEEYHSAERVLAQTGFSVGYFTCGRDVLNSTQFSLSDDSQYSTVCDTNGIVGQVSFKNLYYFTTTDAETYAYLHGPSHCAALSEPIAETIADLPPYSCARTIHPSFLACFATAAANTQLLFQVLVFLSALALSRLAARFPPLKQSLRSEAAPPITSCTVELAEKTKTTEYRVRNPLNECPT